MSSKTKFKFCVGEDDRQRSNIWSVAVNKSDVYLISELSKRSSKVSLHESGCCHCLLTTQYIENNNLQKEHRDGQRWIFDKNNPHPQIIFIIIFPYTELIHLPRRESEKLIRIPKCQDGEYIQVIIYKMALMPDNFTANIPIGYNIFKNFRLSDGSGLLFMYSCEKMQVEHILKLGTVKYNFMKIKEARGIPKEKIIGGNFNLLSSDNTNRICEVYI